VRDASGLWAPLSFALGIGFAAAWLRIVFAGGRLLRRPGPRRFVTAGLGLGIFALTIELIVLLRSPSQEGASWLLLAALAVSLFLLAATLGQPRTEHWHRV
jgi:thiol:disulfide interchange protein